ncbi:hypothetical protein C2H92_09870 [Bacillus halotolerans]|nr:hypothetical protein C2H92_09870 [Bacillus halotolerans]
MDLHITESVAEHQQLLIFIHGVGVSGLMGKNKSAIFNICGAVLIFSRLRQKCFIFMPANSSKHTIKKAVNQIRYIKY